MRALLIFLATGILCLSIHLPVTAQNLLVNSSGGDQTLRFDLYGIYQGVFATSQGLDDPSSLCVAPDGTTFIGMRDAQGQGKVQKRSAAGSLQAEYSIPGLSSVGGVVLDAAGNLYVSDSAANRVLRWDASGNFQGVFASGNGLSRPLGLSLDGERGLLVASADSGEILRWNAGGSFDRVFASVASPVDVECGSDGRVYVLHGGAGGGGVLELHPDGSVRCARIGGVSLASPTGLALRPGDEALFATDAQKGVLFWDDTGGWHVLVPNGQSGLNAARGLAFQTAAVLSRNTINYQGLLTDSTGAPLPDGQYSVTFALYPSDVGGQPLWVSAPQTVTTNAGVFTTLIAGVPETVFEVPEVWVEVRAGSVVMSPRQRFSAVPYAFHSRYASSLATEGAPLICSIGNVTALRLGSDSSFWARASGGATFVTGFDANGLPASGVMLAPGSGAWSTLSDRAAKLGFQRADPEEILRKVRELPVGYWSYRTQDPGIRHIGPTAQDFRSAFGLGEDDKHISTVDADGVILAAIQGLLRRVEENDSRIRDLERRLAGRPDAPEREAEDR